jgi:hypothetical protein
MIMQRIFDKLNIGIFGDLQKIYPVQQSEFLKVSKNLIAEQVLSRDLQELKWQYSFSDIGQIQHQEFLEVSKNLLTVQVVYGGLQESEWQYCSSEN